MSSIDTASALSFELVPHRLRHQFLSPTGIWCRCGPAVVGQSANVTSNPAEQAHLPSCPRRTRKRDHEISRSS